MPMKIEERLTLLQKIMKGLKYYREQYGNISDNIQLSRNVTINKHLTTDKDGDYVFTFSIYSNKPTKNELTGIYARIKPTGSIAWMSTRRTALDFEAPMAVWAIDEALTEYNTFVAAMPAKVNQLIKKMDNDGYLLKLAESGTVIFYRKDDPSLEPIVNKLTKRTE